MLKSFLLSWKQLRQKHEEEHEGVVRAKETQTGKHKKFKGKRSGGIDKKKSRGVGKKKSGSNDKQSRSVDKKISQNEDVITDMFPL